MIVLGIIGLPVSHSKSPAMHAAAARALGLDVVYARFPVEAGAVPDAIRGIRALGIHGVNVTVPHKQAVIPLLDEVSDEARAIGAVNTIVREGSRLVGHNTDARGLVRSLEDAGVVLRGAEVTVLGAGGAARAAVVGLARAGVRSVRVVARRIEQAEALRDALLPHLTTPLSAHASGELASTLTTTTLLVQSTSATLGSSGEAEAFASALPLEVMPKGTAVVDLVYAPLETTVLAKAKALGLVGVDGLGMLLHQGAAAFTLWTGEEPPLDAMRAALR